MSGRKTIAFKGTESQKARVDDVAEALDMTRSDFMQTVVMSYVEFFERDLSHESEVAEIDRRSDQLTRAVRRLDVARAVEEAGAA